MNPSELDDIITMIRQVLGGGVTIPLIEHIMAAVSALAEEVYVLAEARLIARGTPRAIAENPSAVEAYLGHGAAERMTRHA